MLKIRHDIGLYSQQNGLRVLLTGPESLFTEHPAAMEAFVARARRLAGESQLRFSEVEGDVKRFVFTRGKQRPLEVGSLTRRRGSVELVMRDLPLPGKYKDWLRVFVFEHRSLLGFS